MNELVLRVLKQYGLPTVFALAMLGGSFWLVRQTVVDSENRRREDMASLRETVHELAGEVISMERRMDKLMESQASMLAKIETLQQIQLLTRRRVDATMGSLLNVPSPAAPSPHVLSKPVK